MSRTILITGASRGIGRATAEHLANPNTHLILTARDTQALESVDDLIQAKGGSSTLIPHDLRNFPGIQEMATALAGRFVGLDALILNGGTLGRVQSVEDLDPVHWGEVMEANLTANFIFMRAFAPMLRKAKGQILALTTGAVPRPRAFWSAYSASKAGLEALTMCFEKEVAPNISVNLLDPGKVRTDMRAMAYPGEDPATLPSPDRIAEVIAKILTDENRPSGVRFDASEF